MRALVFVVLGCLMFTGPVYAEKGGDIAGVYATSGTNPGGSAPYQGQSEIVAVAGGQYQVVQQIAGDTWTGTGTFDGTDLNVFYPSYNVRAIYTLQPDGSFQGRWGEEGGPLLGTETLTPLQ